MRLFAYNMKILYFQKYLMYILIICIMPFALNLSDTIYFEQLIPLIAIPVFLDVFSLEKNLNIVNIYIVTPYPKYKIGAVRIVISLILYIGLSLFYFIFIQLLGMTNQIDIMAIMISDKFLLLLIGGINYLFYGILATVIYYWSQLKSISIAICIFYAFFWMSMNTSYPQFLFNPYTYSAGVDDFIYKLITLLVCMLLIGTLFLKSKTNYNRL